MINRIIDDPKYAFKNPGNAIQMIHNGEKYIWLHNRYIGVFDFAINHLADKKEKTQRLKDLESALGIDLFLENQFAEDYKTSLLKKEAGIIREFDTKTMPLKQKSITEIQNRTGIDLTEKNLTEAYKILFSYITEEEKNNPPITKSFFDRLIKKAEHNFRYKIEDSWDFEILDKIPDFVVGVGGYKFRDNKLYLTHKLNHNECSFELPALRTDFGTRILGTKIIYE